MKYKKIITIILILMLTCTGLANNYVQAEPNKTNANASESSNNNLSKNTNADSNTFELPLNCEACVLMEKSTKRFPYEKNADKKMYPASTTKILTAILTVENCKMDDVVTITNAMTSQVPTSYTTAYLKPGEKVTVEQLLNVLLIPSANDAGFALAVHISGSTENFAELMNAKALEIGCTNSHFTNPCGIQDVNHYSTAKDMALIGMYATSYPQIMDIVCKTSYTLAPTNSNARTFETTNTLITPSEPNYYEFATGMKTGYTKPAGSCLIATAKKDNMEFLAVVLNAPESTNTIKYRDVDCKTLFDYGFENYEEITKVDDSILQFLKNALITESSDATAYKYLLIFIGVLLFFALLKICTPKSKKSKKSKRR